MYLFIYLLSSIYTVYCFQAQSNLYCVPFMLFFINRIGKRACGSYHDFRCNFRIETMFSSSLPPVVCRIAHVLFAFFVIICVWWCLIYIVLCLFIYLLSSIYTVYCFQAQSNLYCVPFMLFFINRIGKRVSILTLTCLM
jgi:hypothetical protein